MHVATFKDYMCHGGQPCAVYRNSVCVCVCVRAYMHVWVCVRVHTHACMCDSVLQV